MSDVSVDIIKNRSGEAPDLPSGANLSGVSTAATLQVTNLNPTHINASGVTTATTFSGSLKSTGTPTLGLGVTINSSGINISGVATAGIVSATTLYGDGSNLTGVAFSIAPISYNPDVSDSTVPKASGIGLTFTERVIAGSGNVTLRIAGAAGTVVENFGVGSSVTINNNTVSIDPTSDLTQGETYYISYPSGAFTNTAGDLDYVGTAYTFGAKPSEYQLWSWGQNGSGMLGHNNETFYSSPTQIAGTNWSANTAHGNAISALTSFVKTDGTLWVWGKNQGGTLGQNQAAAQLAGLSSPTQIPGTTWKEVAAGDYNILMTKTDGTLWGVGLNEQGGLGVNDKADRSSPVQIPGTTWNDITTSGASAFATKTDGTLWAWGSGWGGKLGVSSWTQYSSPIQIPGTTWRSVRTDSITMATKTDGTLFAWGYQSSGSLAQNDQVHYSSPVQIPGTNWSANISTSSAGSCATKTDGTLWQWGGNGYGQLGQNQAGAQLAAVSSPVQVGSETTWSDVVQGYGFQLATKTDGTLWAWGFNHATGGLGQNQSYVDRSSPVQIGSDTTWVQPYSARYGSFGIKEV